MTKLFRQKAIALAKLGYSVFPLRPNDKKTMPGSKGCHDGTTNPVSIKAWGVDHPDANIGIHCTGLVVIDLDEKDGKTGIADLEAIATELGPLPDGPVVETPTGGRHLYFKAPATDAKNAQGVKWNGRKTGIDIRTHGGYVLAPGSKIGNQYYVVRNPLPAVAELPELPETWINRFLKRKESPSPPVIPALTLPMSDDLWDRIERYLDAIPPAVQGQDGSGTLYWAVSSLMWGFLLDDATVKRLILERYNHRCKPAWSEKEIDHKINDARKNPMNKQPGWLLEENVANGLIPLTPDLSNILAQVKAVSPPDRQPKLPENRFHIWSCADLMNADLSINFLIENVLVEGQPMILGGAKKVLKTSIMLDMCVALSTGVPFLRRFEVPEKKRVLVMSGESGLVTIRDTIRRVSQAAGVDPGVNRSMFICDSLPRLADPGHILQLREKMDEYQPNVVALDPAYLMIEGEKAENVMVMGQQLARITQLCIDYGATLILAHHFSKTRTDDTRIPELNDLSQSGFAEFARQWLLLGRRKAYVPGLGEHELNLVIGGSAGHQGKYSLHVSEGIYPDRLWNVSVVDTDALVHSIVSKVNLPASLPPPLDEKSQKVLDVMAAHTGPMTQRTIRDETPFNTKTVADILKRLVAAGRVSTTSMKAKNGKMVDHYRATFSNENQVN